MEEERKKKEEQEWRRKEEQERAMQEAKRKEEDEARVAAAARVQQEREQAVLQVSVKTVTGKNFVVPGVSRSATIAELKQKINDMFQIAKERQRMIFAGSILDDSGTIEQYKIQEGSFVHLVEKDPPAGSATASPRTAIAPSGKVEHIHQGKTQLDQILMACGSERLLVVDWSAPWCGPCRMIAPQFENLARQFPDVSFASVDTEASSENASLSRQEMIRAFPTFFFYRNMQKLHEFAGANLMMLNQKIDELRSPFPIPTSSSISRSIPNLVSGTITVPPGNTLVERVFNGLSTLKRSCSSNDFVLAVNTLITFLRNIVNNPSDPKYRRIRLSNMAFASRLGRHPGGINCMAAFGFQVTNEGGEQYLVMSDTAGRDSALEDTLRQLEAVVPTSDRAGGGSSSARSATNSASGATTSPSFGMPGAAGADPQLLGALMADPAIAEIFGDLMRDPQGMSELSSAMAAFQSGNMSALNSLSQNPRMRRLTELMMQNPIALQRISEAASRMGMPGHLSGSLQPQGPVAGNTPPPPAQHFDGEPTSAEEEERLLAEAIRLSMEDSNNAFNQGGAQGQKKKDGDDAAS
uniref:Ubiquitin-like domain-containing protein n=1 Tax=Compsopogon caeruleus TaxID=31354 RepID=A0A7S1THR3_9RHOD